MAKKKELEVCFESKLKKLSVEQIEQAVEKAISELVGDEYQIHINKIDFSFEFGQDSCDMHLSIENSSGIGDIPF